MHWRIIIIMYQHYMSELGLIYQTLPFLHCFKLFVLSTSERQSSMANTIHRADATRLLRGALGPDADFRSGQWEAIDAIVNARKRLLVVERTGWGKSTVYFLSTRLLRMRQEGITLIVSPLISLMRNQIYHAKQFGVQAVTINSSNSDEWQQHFEV